MTVNRETFCTYEEGMLANEAALDPDGFDTYPLAIGLEAARHHETAHSVLAFACGFCASPITLLVRRSYDGILQYGGWATAGGSDRAISLRRYSRRVFACGVECAAGPAASRKFCIETGAPIRASGLDDHRTLTRIGDGLSVFARRDGRAFRRLVWRSAQRMLEDPAIWAAVRNLAGELSYPDLDVIEPGDYTETMPARIVRTIARAAGVRRGHFGFTIH